MVAQFLGLKLRIMVNAFRRSPWQIVGLTVSLIYGLIITGLFVIGLFAARLVDDISLVQTVIVVIGAFVVLGFLFLPLLFGVDDTLDPRKFSLYGMPNLRLATGLAIAALIGIPSIVLTICSLATVVTWSRNPGSAFVALLCAVIAVLTCVLGARVTTSIAAFLLATRRSREFSGIIAILILVLISPLVALLFNIDWVHHGIAVLNGVSAWLSWTPLGAAWSVPGDLLQGKWGPAALKFLIAVAFLGVLWLSWVALVSKMLVAPERQARAKGYAGLGWFSSLPGGAMGSIAARTATYWGRDPRYWVVLVMIPVFPAFMVVALLIAGVPAHYVVLLPLPVMCLFLGWTIHNDLAFDSTAIWLHIVSGTRGYADRAGRTFPVLLIGIPLIAVGSIVTTNLFGNWIIMPSVIGLSTSVLLIGIGLSSIASALFPYPATKPGDSAFSQPQTAGGSAVLVQSISFLAIIIFATPVIAFVALGLFVSPLWFTGAPIAGIIIGLVVMIGGLYLGGKIFDRRGPEIVAFATRNG
jgi:ABC-2 type transport system permease protein